MLEEFGRPLVVQEVDLAEPGAGEVLGGVIGALLATGLTAYDAASVGAWLHGAAATLASDGGIALTCITPESTSPSQTIARYVQLDAIRLDGLVIQ